MIDKTILSSAINKKFTEFSDSIQEELHKKLANHYVFKKYASEFDKIQSMKIAYADINDSMNEDNSIKDTYNKISGLSKIALQGYARRINYPELLDLKSMDEDDIIQELLAYEYNEKDVDKFYKSIMKFNEAKKPKVISIPAYYDAILIVNQLGRVGLKARAVSSDSDIVNVDLYDLDDQDILLDWMDSKGYNKKDIKLATKRPRYYE